MPRYRGRHATGSRHLAGPRPAGRSGRHLRPAPATGRCRHGLAEADTGAVDLCGRPHRPAVSFPDATATTVTARFGASADAYVAETRPTANFGSERELLAAGTPKVRRSYLRFEVANLSGTVAKATVRLHSRDNSETGYEVRALTDSRWLEQTITYNNAPPPGPVVAAVPGPPPARPPA